MNNSLLPDTPIVSGPLIELKEADYKTTIDVLPDDIAYYAIRAFEELKEDTLFTSGFSANPYEPIKRTFAELEEDGSTPMRELQFLETLGLAVHRPEKKKYYISPLAFILYEPGVGLFSTADSAATTWLFLRYILPGHYWRAFYNKVFLPDTIYSEVDLKRRMDETRGKWAQLRPYYAGSID